MDEGYFWDKMSWEDTLDAVFVSGMPEEVFEWCFEVKNKQSIKISRTVNKK